MVKTVEAFFDGEVLRPTEPLELAPNTKVRITVEVGEASRREPSLPTREQPHGHGQSGMAHIEKPCSPT